MSKPILRYQDKEGRGPFRPGVPAIWADAEGDSPVAVFERFPELSEALSVAHAKGLNVGCACVGWDGLRRYFTKAERQRLHDLGYRVHRAPTSDVLLSDDVEAVFATRRALKDLPRALWPTKEVPE